MHVQPEQDVPARVGVAVSGAGVAGEGVTGTGVAGKGVGGVGYDVGGRLIVMSHSSSTTSETPTNMKVRKGHL